MPKSQAVAEKIRSGALVVDVRSPMEYGSGNVAGSINIPMEHVPYRLNEFGSKESPIIVYCRSGNRSGMVKNFLESAGFKDVVNGGGLHDML